MTEERVKLPYHGEYIVNQAENRDGRGRRNPVNDYPESLQLEVPTCDTHKNTNFHYPPPEAMAPIVSLLFYFFLLSPQGSSTGLT